MGMEGGLSTGILRGEGADPSLAGDFSLTADQLRAHEYSMLAVLLSSAPDQTVLEALSGLKGDVTPFGLAHIHLADAARVADPDQISREFFHLFTGVGRGELVPFASYYQTGFLQEKPLARLRADLQALGIERAPELREPEDHIAVLCEIMSGICSGALGTPAGTDRKIFERHLKPWAARFFADLETAEHARFYRHVGAIGRMLMEIETEALNWAA
jgi:TorA maturation chaperone TorD